MTWQLIKDALLGKEQDFTRLPLKTAIFLLALPMILEMMMESSFALVDIFFVAQLGEYAIATVGLTESVIVLTYALGFGLSMAATALVSRRFGEKNYEDAGSVTFQLLLVGALVSIVLGVLGWTFAGDLLRLMGAEEQLVESGSKYAKIVFAGNTAILLLFLWSLPRCRSSPPCDAFFNDFEWVEYRAGSLVDFRHRIMGGIWIRWSCHSHYFWQKCGGTLPIVPPLQWQAQT